MGTAAQPLAYVARKQGQLFTWIQQLGRRRIRWADSDYAAVLKQMYIKYVDKHKWFDMR